MLNMLDFSGILSARLCHDLAGPISAVASAIELINFDSSETKAKALALIKQSSDESVARLRYFRFAYSMAEAKGEMDMEEIRSVITDMYSQGKIKVEWTKEASTAMLALTPTSGRLLLNLILIAVSSLIYGGTIHIKLAKVEKVKVITVVGVGSERGIKKLDEARAILLNDINTMAETLSLRNVQVYLTKMLIEQLQVQLEMVESSERIELTAALPSS